MDSIFWLFKQLVGVFLAVALLTIAFLVLLAIYHALAGLVRVIREGSGNEKVIAREEAARRRALGYDE